MTDADLDARARELRDDDLKLLAEDATADCVAYLRPGLLRQCMAKEILRLRAEIDRLNRGDLTDAEMDAVRNGFLNRRLQGTSEQVSPS